MADLALTTANKVEVVLSIEQFTKPCAAAISAGQPIMDNGSGKWTPSTGTNTTQAFATRTSQTNEALTGIAKGLLCGWDFGTNTVGTGIGNGTSTIAVAGTNTVFARIEAGNAALLGSNPDKLLRVNL
jgi:hypothetical protein